MHWFEAAEVAAFAAELANEPRMRRRLRKAAGPSSNAKAGQRSADEVAAMVFERLDQRQTLAEIVVAFGSRPSAYASCTCSEVRAWSSITSERRAPLGPLDRDFVRVTLDELAARLAELPEGLTRISVGRYRGKFYATTPRASRPTRRSPSSAASSCPAPAIGGDDLGSPIAAPVTGQVDRGPLLARGPGRRRRSQAVRQAPVVALLA